MKKRKAALRSNNMKMHEEKILFCVLVKPISWSDDVLCVWSEFLVWRENIQPWKMGLNRLLSLSKSNVVPELKSASSKPSKIAVKTSSDRENRKEKCKVKETSADISTQKIDKTLKNGKSATTTKKSILWNTLRITNKNKSCVKKGNSIGLGVK